MSLLTLKFDNTKLNRLIRNWDTLIRDYEKTIKRADEEIIKEIIKILREEMPKITGNLRESVTFEELAFRVGDRVYLIGHDKNKTKTEDGKHSYGDIVYYGIRDGYFIYPVNAKALRFEIGGEVIFAKKVYIPPRKGNKFIDRVEKRIIRAKLGAKIYKKEFQKIRYIN